MTKQALNQRILEWLFEAMADLRDNKPGSAYMHIKKAIDALEARKP